MYVVLRTGSYSKAWFSIIMTSDASICMGGCRNRWLIILFCHIQQQGGGAGGPPIYPMPGSFPPTGLLPDVPGSELMTVLTPTTLAPPYQDMGYAAQCLLMSQAQQLGSFPTGFQQHTLTKARSVIITLLMSTHLSEF